MFFSCSKQRTIGNLCIYSFKNMETRCTLIAPIMHMGWKGKLVGVNSSIISIKEGKLELKRES